MRCPRGCSTSWTITCGSSPTSGRSSPIRTSRSTGSSPGTSVRSTQNGETGGCSATATAAPTCSSSPGRRSPGTPWSRAGVPGRPGPGSLLGGPATTRETPAGPGQAPAPAEAARALPALRAAAAPHRPRAGTPRRMGTLDHSDPQGARPPCAHPRHRTRGRGRHHRVPSRPRSLPGPPARRHPKLTSTSAAPTRSPPGLA